MFSPFHNTKAPFLFFSLYYCIFAKYIIGELASFAIFLTSNKFILHPEKNSISSFLDTIPLFIGFELILICVFDENK